MSSDDLYDFGDSSSNSYSKTGTKYHSSSNSSNSNSGGLNKSNKENANNLRERSGSSGSEDASKYTVRRYAIKYDPPTLVVEYYENESGKKFVRKIKFKKGKSSGKDAKAVTSRIIDNNSDILDRNSIDEGQLEDLVSLLLADESGTDDYYSSGHGGYNSSSSDNNLSKKESSVSSSSHSNHDIHNNNNTNDSSHINNSNSNYNGGKVSVEDLSSELKNMMSMNLNKASDEVVERAKALMGEAFERNRVLPGSEGFEYDRRVEFAPAVEKSDWDDDEDDE